MNLNSEMRTSLRADPRNDYGFKNMFQNVDVLTAFLRDILVDPSIESVVRAGTELPKRGNKGKGGSLDFVCRKSNGDLFIVEIQRRMPPQNMVMRKRVVYYASHLFSTQLREGEGYNKLCDVVMIVILDENMFSSSESLAYKNVLKITNEEGTITLDHIKWVFLELRKVNRSVNEAVALNDVAEMWLFFFKFASVLQDEEIDILAKEQRAFKLAASSLDCSSWPDEDRIEYTRSVIARADEVQMRNEIINEEKFATAKRMLKRQCEDNMIMDCLEISEAQLLQVKSSM